MNGKFFDSTQQTKIDFLYSYKAKFRGHLES